MKRAVSLAIKLSLCLAVVSGCSNEAAEEQTTSHDDALVGVLTSPLGLKDKHLLDGAWVPVDPDTFRGEAKPIHFDKDEGGARTYRLATEGCAPEDSACTNNGVWFITDNPVAWFFAGTYIVFKPNASPNSEKSLFVWRKADGEIRLVDLSTWDWSQLSYRNTWRKAPQPLIVTDL